MASRCRQAYFRKALTTADQTSLHGLRSGFNLVSRQSLRILPSMIKRVAAIVVGLIFSLTVDAADFYLKFDAIKKSKGKSPERERLHQLFDTAWEYSMIESPESATYVGFPGQNDRWMDISVPAIERRKREAHWPLETIRTIDRAQLDATDKLSYDLMLRNLEREIEEQKFPGEYLPITQLNGVQQGIAPTIAVMPATKVSHYRDIIARLKAAGKHIDETIDLMKLGLKAGVTPPRITLRDVPQQVKNQIFDDALKSPLMEAFKKFPKDIPTDTQATLQKDGIAVYRAVVKPAFERLHQFLVETYLPGCRESISMSALPNGQAWYAFRVEDSTTTKLTPKQIHEIGQSEVKRIRAEMQEVMVKSGFKGTLPEFFEFLRTDKQFFYDTGPQLLAGYRDISKRIDAELPRLFGKLPRLPYGVSPVPSYAEKSQTTAYYMPGSARVGRPGTFFANTYELSTRPKWEMEALTVHEAVPGHHLQISIAHEMENMPEFRKHGGYTAFVEGWGLYSESLGEEIGLYQDPYSKFGQLTYEMWRAIRLVVDTGMHSMGWSRQQAIDFFKQNSGKTEHDIVVEIDRYIVWPGQALAYKIGQLKMKELRALATKELGERFDIRAFHDELLGNGALPLEVLEAHMKEWISARKAMKEVKD